MSTVQLIYLQTSLFDILVTYKLIKVFGRSGFFKNNTFAISTCFINFIGKFIYKKTRCFYFIVFVNFIKHIQHPGSIIGLSEILYIGKIVVAVIVSVFGKFTFTIFKFAGL